VRRIVGLVVSAGLVLSAPLAAQAAPTGQYQVAHSAGKPHHHAAHRAAKRHHPAPAKHSKISNATFGAAPASPKGADGRPYFTFDSTPGGVLTDHLAITNFTNQPEKLSVYPVDAVPASNGTISFPTRSAPRTAAGAWLAVGTPKANGELTLPPRASLIVPVRIKVPSNAPPGDHVGAVVVSLAGLVSGRFGQGGVQRVKFNQRIAVRAVFRVSGPSHPNLSIEGVKPSYDGPMDPFARGRVKVSYVVRNLGNVVLGGTQTVTVHGLFGEHDTAAAVADLPPLLPGASYPMTVQVPSVYPEVLMSATVLIHPAPLQGEPATGLTSVSSSVHFLAIPWILLVVLLLLLLGLGLWYWRRRRRRRSQSPVGRHRAPVEAQGVKA
jgi:hypothetical protein